MSMSRKDYELIADRFQAIRLLGLDGTEPSQSDLNTAIRFLADAFEDENPRFNRSKFLVAAGYEEVA